MRHLFKIQNEKHDNNTIIKLDKSLAIINCLFSVNIKCVTFEPYQTSY